MKSTATANPVVSGMFQKFMRDTAGWVAEAIAPTFNSAEQSAQYYVFDRENSLMVPTDIKRAPGAPHKEVSMQISDDFYNCENYGIGCKVPDEIRKKYANFLDADSAAANRIADTLKINRELRVKALVTDTAVVPNATPVIKWDQPDCNPKVDVDAARENIRLGIGRRPNTMVMSETVRLACENNPEIRKAFQLAINGRVTNDMLRAYFNIDNIVIADQVLATNVEGRTLTSADIWGEEVLLAFVRPGQDLMLLNFARSFNWTEIAPIDGKIKTIRLGDEESDKHNTDHATDEKIVCAHGGFLLTDTLAGV
jgi:hypothetical protein